MTEPRFESVTLDPRALGFLQFKAASLLWRPNFRSQVNTPSIFPLSGVYGKVAVENVFKVSTSGIFCGVNNEIKEDLLSGSSSRGSALVHFRAGALPGGSRGVRVVPVPLPYPLRLQNQEGFHVSSYILLVLLLLCLLDSAQYHWLLFPSSSPGSLKTSITLLNFIWTPRV